MATTIAESRAGHLPLRRGRGRRDWLNLRNGLLFTAPGIIGLLWFFAYPIAASFFYSFTSYDGLHSLSWVGLSNYTNLLKDGVFWTSLYNTAYFVLFSVPLNLLAAFLMALLLNQNWIRGLAFFRTIFFIPSIVPLIASSVLFLWIFNPQYGLINTLLSYVGINGPGWLNDPTWAKPALIIMGLWSVGGWMVIFLAGLQNVPVEQYEAAQLDGASAWQRLVHITLPFMSPYFLFNAINGLILSFQYFLQPYVMTQGGPAESTTMYAVYLYQNAFQYYRMGYASAMGWILFVIIAVLTYILFKSSARRVYYGS
jgi:multiple sugar transport system permease protein